MPFKSVPQPELADKRKKVLVIGEAVVVISFDPVIIDVV